jgi:hypothetical protein
LGVFFGVIRRDMEWEKSFEFMGIFEKKKGGDKIWI